MLQTLLSLRAPCKYAIGTLEYAESDQPSPNNLTEVGEKALDAANRALSVVDTDAEEVAGSLKRLSGQVVKVTAKQRVVAENCIREARDVSTEMRSR